VYKRQQRLRVSALEASESKSQVACFVVLVDRRDGFNLSVSGEVNGMFVLRVYAYVTAGITVGLAMMAAFMNTPRR
jgi:hypothetical protein